MQKRSVVRISSFIAILLSWFYTEYIVNSSLVATLSYGINKVTNLSGSSSSAQRKWRHIQVVTDDRPVKISFRLYDPTVHPIDHKFNDYYTCPLGELMQGKGNRYRSTGEVRSGDVPDDLMRTANGRVLEFTSTISTSLKLISIGDSVTVQFSFSLDEMLGGDELSSRTVLWDSWIGHLGGSIVWPTNGGGASATWRMTGLLSKKCEGLPPANNKGGGWSMKDVEMFLKHENGDLLSSKPAVGKFDVVIFRTMHGWMPTEDITYERFIEAIHMAAELLGAETVILQTIPFTNNVKTVDDWKDMHRINNVLRNIAKNWHRQNSTKRIKHVHVLVHEYGQYINHITWMNARYLGYNVSNPVSVSNDILEKEGPTFLLDRLKDGKQFSASIPMVCSDLESLGRLRNKCNRNYLISDGMHVCPERLSFRYAVSLACLIGCVYNRNDSIQGSIRGCERECNDLFMSVEPVDNDWVDGNVTLASFA